MKNGWIKLHRKVAEHETANNPRWFSVWIHLLLMATHNRSTFLFNGKIMKLNEGEILTGRKEISRISGVSESTVEDILNYLERQQQIRQRKTTKNRIITILNWHRYQNPTTKATTKRQQKDTYKKIKKNNNTYMFRVWNEELGDWESSKRGKSKPNPMRSSAEKILSAYLAEFKRQGGKLEDVPKYDKAAYLRQAYITLKLYDAETLIKLLPIYFDDDFFKSTKWPIWCFLSPKEINKLKNGK
jgi:hypothetical protein